MDINERFLHDEEESPVTNHTWPLSNKVHRQRRCHQLKMSSLLSPVTPKRSYSHAATKSLLLQCLRDSKSDPLPRSSRRFFASSYDSDDGGVLMDGVLVTSATGKRGSDSPCSSLGRSSSSRCSSVIRNQHKNAEFSSPRSDSGRNQETTRSQHSSAGKAKMSVNSPSKKVETPKAANPSKLQATAEPFIFTPRSSQSQQLPYDHDLHFQCCNTPPHQQLPSSYVHQNNPPSYAYPRPPPPLFLHLPRSYPQGPDLYHTRSYLSPRPTGYDFNQSPVHTPVSTNRTTNLGNITTTIHGSRLDLSSSVDGLNTVTQRPDLSSHPIKLETMTTQELDLSSPCDLHETTTTMTQRPVLSSTPNKLETTMTEKPDLSSLCDKLETTTVTQRPVFSSLPDEFETTTTTTVTQRPVSSSLSDKLETEPDLSSSLSDKLETTTTTVTQEQDWSPSDDGLETLTKAQTEFTKSQDRILPDDVFEHYKYRERLPVFLDETLFGSQDSSSST